MNSPTLDELTKKLELLSDKERLELSQQVQEMDKYECWHPTAGPQLDAYLSPADILLYGGQAGGGKTGLVCGLALTQHKSSLILRRQYSDVDAITRDCLRFYGTRDGFNGSPPATLRTTKALDGVERVIDFGGCKLPEDKESYRGKPHDLKCVGRGTYVLMANGAYKKIETISAGQFVHTLEGPRKVNRTYRFPSRPSCLLRALGFEQIQSCDHEILTNVGWVSHGMSGESRLSESFLPTQTRYENKLSVSFCRSSVRFFRRLLSRSSHRWLSVSPQSLWLDPLGWLGSYVFSQQSSQGTDYGSSGGERRLPWLHRLLFLFLVPSSPSPVFQGGERTARYSSFLYDEIDALKKSLSEGWLGHCLSGFRLCGERIGVFLGLSPAREVCQVYLHRSFDVGQPNPSGLMHESVGQTPTHNGHTGEYSHPYTKDIRQAQGQAIYSSFSTTYVGERELFDLEVEEVNHFITHGGFVNKNCFDEASQFLEDQVRFIIAWNRPADDDRTQRCRVILASNPPESPASGRWLFEWFRPWLDPDFPDPAEPGELRWFISNEEGEDTWVDGPEEIEVEGRVTRPLSRTFISASLDDNPFLKDTNYASQLDALPEPLRSAIRDGNWMISAHDDEFQVIPTNWIMAAQRRWTEKPPDAPMCVMGVDVASGGRDKTVLAPRYDTWFAPLIILPGSKTPYGTDVAALVVKYRRDNAEVVIDMGGGFGGGPYDHLKSNGLPVFGFNAVSKTAARTKDRMFPFLNKRAEAHWRFREALDPDQPGGSPIMLPKDPELLADLVAPRFGIGTQGIQIESKEDIKKRLGHSPDRGDTVIMAWSKGPSYKTHGSLWRGFMKSQARPKTIRSYSHRRRQAHVVHRA